MKYLNLFFAIIFCLLQQPILFGQSDIRQKILETLETYEIPSISIGVIHDRELCWSESFGYAEIASERLATTETMYGLASVTKTITATATFQLVERDSFDLDDDINDYLDSPIRNPNFPEAPITFRMLLKHTSSINVSENLLNQGYAFGDPVNTLEDFVYDHLNTEGDNYDVSSFTSYRPGTRAVYSNSAIALLGYLVEKISGMPFNEFCNVNIFEPLEMDNTRFFISELDTSLLARPYSVRLPGVPFLVAVPHYGYPDYPNGLLRSNVPDLFKFMSMYMNDGTLNGQTILSEESIEELVPTNSADGHVWYRYDLLTPGNIPSWGHDGDDVGVLTTFLFDNNRENGLIVLINRDEIPFFTEFSFWNDLFEYALGNRDCALLTNTTTIDENPVLSVSPNPASSAVEIKSDSDISEIRLLNVDGKVIKQLQCHNQRIVQVDVHDMKSGTYIVSVIKASGETHTQRLIKVK